MPETLRTTIAQFSSAGGRWQPRAANVRAVEPAPDLPSAERGSLYVLMEVSGGGQWRCTARCSTLRRPPSMKRAREWKLRLQQAVRSAHQVLRQANEGLPEAQWRGGGRLVVRYGDRVTLRNPGQR